MGNIDDTRKDFQTGRTPKKLFGKIDAHYLLLLTFLIRELRKDKINQRELNREVEAKLNNFTDDISTEVYSALEDEVVNGMAEALFAVVAVWSITEAKSFLETSHVGPVSGGFTQPSNLGGPNEALVKLAHKRLSGIITAKDARDAIVSSGLQHGPTRVLFEDTFKDILGATQNTDRRLKRVIREVAMEVIQEQSLLSQGNTQLAKVLSQRLTTDALYNRLTKDGLIGIVDRGGKRWNVDVYSKMVVNTKLTQAHMEATRRLGEQMGLDLAVISAHSAIDACLHWEGVVVSVNGRTAGFPALDDVIATNELFHPNCRHHIQMITSLDQLSPHDRLIHEQKLPKVARPELRPYRRKS